MNLIAIDTNILENRINDLKSSLKDVEAVKEIITRTPSILSDDNVLSADYVTGLLLEADFDLEEQKLILEENTNIFKLDRDILEESIHMLVRCLKEKFKLIVMENPEIIGIIDEKYLEEYLNEGEV